MDNELEKIKTQNIVAIIPAAGKPTNKILVNSNLPDTMLPINGKPVIGYIFEDLINRKISKIVVVLNSSDSHTEEYLLKKFKSKCEFQIIYDNELGRGVGHSISLAGSTVKDTDEVLIYLGDTIYKGNLSFEHDFLVTTKEYDASDKWCFVEQVGEKIDFINKPKNYIGHGEVLCGLYFLKNGKDFKETVLKFVDRLELIELSDLLKEYIKKHDFKFINAEGWYDCGNVENYYKAKIDFLKIRSFNSVTYNDLYGFITKTGIDREKIIHELNWFQNIPNELKIFSPRLVDYNISEKSAQYSLEFYGYQSLADNFLFGSLNIRLWQSVIDRLFEILDLYKKHQTKLPFHFFHEMYFKKTTDRLDGLKKDLMWEKLLTAKEIVINGKTYNNFNYYKDKLENCSLELYEDGLASVIHGDLCLSNILYDHTSRIFKFIDPRGSFGERSVYGDSKYDVAKLRHSFCGFYDFIVSDLFDLAEVGDLSFTLDLHIEKYHQDVSDYFDQKLISMGHSLEKIKLIETLLFFSMIPLHSDNVARQKAMYLTGVRLINQVIAVN